MSKYLKMTTFIITPTKVMDDFLTYSYDVAETVEFLLNHELQNFLDNFETSEMYYEDNNDNNDLEFDMNDEF